MKNSIKILCLSLLLSFSCESKFDGGEFSFTDFEDVVLDNTPIVEATGKKGSCFTTNSLIWSKYVSDLKSHWHYTWGPNLSDRLPDNVEFVPMQWGKWGLNDDRVATLKALKATGKIHYLLGFNEPDGVEQANMTVDQAIALWPLLEQVGLPLGSPATVNPTNDWMKEFMRKANEKGLRIDFVTVHSYGGPSADALVNKLREVYELYQKPIWITEFAVADWNATTVADNKFTPTQVLNFMKDILPRLEALDFVHRYSWFSFSQTSTYGSPSALFDGNGNLTPLGEYYSQFMPNENIGPPK